ncbi:MAG: hypothetical protein QM804_09925 [Propionicimonas sp.]
MIGILIAGHGEIAAGVLSAAQLILGPIDQVETLALTVDLAPETFGDQVVAAGERLDTGDGLVILTDLRGGTPFNQSALATRDRRWAVVCGLSLPMFIQAIESRVTADLPDLIEQVKAAAADGIVSIKGKAV